MLCTIWQIKFKLNIKHGEKWRKYGFLGETITFNTQGNWYCIEILTFYRQITSITDLWHFKTLHTLNWTGGCALSINLSYVSAIMRNSEM